MPQLDFSILFLQFITISSLIIIFIWMILVNFLTIIYAVTFTRKVIFDFFESLKK